MGIGWVRRRRTCHGLLVTPLEVAQLEQAFGISVAPLG